MEEKVNFGERCLFSVERCTLCIKILLLFTIFQANIKIKIFKKCRCNRRKKPDTIRYLTLVSKLVICMGFEPMNATVKGW